MGQTRLTIQFGPGFSGDLWTWKVSIRQAASGRVEVVWETYTSGPRAEREHRFRARAMPDWWPELAGALDQIHFDALPPSKKWDVVMDDVGVLSLERQDEDVLSCFSIFYAPELWPAVPGETREALQKVMSILDPLARRMHAE
jgi:hypothetical protein